MKQEKNQTAWPELQPWQKDLWHTTSGLKKGELFVVSAGRGTGKSMLTAMHMATHIVGAAATFGSSWEEWQDIFVWPWNAKISVESKKKIWGRIQIRYNKVVYASDGKRERQYATKQEAFKRKLRGLD